uniref:Mucin-2-like n=1 Tax=Nicotiana sylvestris TaxID=4096 RepID=A0A1U7V0M4_NICSY|nr:PREDICTED: mucin-2-like [Nicotiana sylvestris]
MPTDQSGLNPVTIKCPNINSVKTDHETINNIHNLTNKSSCITEIADSHTPDLMDTTTIINSTHEPKEADSPKTLPLPLHATPDKLSDKIHSPSISDHLQKISLHATQHEPITNLPSPMDQHSFSIPMDAHHYPPCDKPLPLLNPTPIIHNETSHTNTTLEPPINLPNPNITTTTKPCNAKTLVYNLQRKSLDQSPPLSLPTSDNEWATPPTTHNTTDLHIPNTTSRISTPIMVRDGATEILPNLHTRTQQPGDHTPRPKSNLSGKNCNRGDEVRDGRSESAPMDQHPYSPTVGTHKAININLVSMGSSDFPTSIQLPPSHRSPLFLPTTPYMDDLCPVISTHKLILTPTLSLSPTSVQEPISPSPSPPPVPPPSLNILREQTRLELVQIMEEMREIRTEFIWLKGFYLYRLKE